MDATVQTLNAFIEDTCVLIAVAYLLARGRMLALLFRMRLRTWEALGLGLVLGMVGLTESAFPGARFPYTTNTLIVTFAVLAGGSRVGVIAATVVALGAVILRSPQPIWYFSPTGEPTTPLGTADLRSPQPIPVTILSVFASVLLAEVVRRVFGARHRLWSGLAAGLLSQSAALGIRALLASPAYPEYSTAISIETVAANGFGVMLLLLVINDAKIRADSERHRAEAERAHALVAEAQLEALRACVHPHFLFNTLTSIAALCTAAPARAEAAIIRLGQLMRRALQANTSAPPSLGEEIESVNAYLEIEQLRLADRLQVSWRIDPGSEQARVPTFAVQRLVENAIQHGIAAKLEPGRITISVRRYPRHTLIAVADDGAGMTANDRRRAFTPSDQQMHGVQTLTQQLSLLYNEHARVRLFSRIDQGTLAVFVLPEAAEAISGRRPARMAAVA